MFRDHKQFYKQLYRDPFQSPRANRKHAMKQVNGETMKSQSMIILERHTSNDA